MVRSMPSKILIILIHLALLVPLFPMNAGAGFTAKVMLTAVKLPPGFVIRVYADDVPGARSMAMSPSGVLYVGTRNTGKVYAVLDQDGDKRADRVITLADGLEMPNGVAFWQGNLYVAEAHRILRYRQIESQLLKPPPAEIVYDQFPPDPHHGWKYLRFGPDGRLYVSVGAPCNACLSENPVYATISRMNRDGSAFEIFAQGVRSSMGFDWQPQTGLLWFTDNGRDWLGDDLPPDELNKAPVKGLHFGFPYCYGGDLRDPELGSERPCDAFTAPAVRFDAHAAALGMRFYTGRMFPRAYRNQIFIAEHGSWNRSRKSGYRVTLVRLKGEKAVRYEPFASGWRIGNTAWGRPVDVEEMGDGSLLVSDDQNGMIYRISWAPTS